MDPISGQGAEGRGPATPDTLGSFGMNRGQLRGTALVAPVQPGTLQVHWPEAEVLIDRASRAAAGVPNYNAIVRLDPAKRDRATTVATRR